MRKLMYLTLAVCLMMAGAVAANAAEPAAAKIGVVRQLVERSKNLGKLTYYKLHTRSERGLELIDKAVSGELELNASCAGIATIGPCIATHVGEHAVGLLSYPAELHSPLLDEVDMFYNVAC